MNILNDEINKFMALKEQSEALKAEMDASNKLIKEYMTELKVSKYVTPEGVIASTKLQTKYTYNENELVTYLRSLNKDYALKVVPNLDIVKAELQSKALDESVVDTYRKKTEIVALTVSRN